MRSRRTLVVAAVAVAAAIWAVVQLRSEAPTSSATVSRATGERRAVPVGGPRRVASAGGARSSASREEGPAAYLRGLPDDFKMTDVDGGLPTDEEGNFLPSATALRAFNYFLSASGAEPQAQTLGRLEAYIREQLVPPALEQALDFLNQFLSYRDAGLALRDRIQRVGMSVEQQAEALSELRVDFFGEELAAELFGREEALREHQMRARQFQDDSSLSESERWALIEASEQVLPEDVRMYRAQSRKSTEARAVVTEMRARGASEGEIFAYRADSLGSEAAARLADLDERRAELDRQVERYLAYAADLSDYSLEEQSELLSDYLEADLTPQQARRIKGLAELRRQGNPTN